MMTRPGQDQNACRNYETLLESYLDGELSSGEAEAVSKHMAACGACREAVEVARASARLLRASGEPAGDPGAAFTARVMAAVRAQEEKEEAGRGFWGPVEELSSRLALSAALALALLVGYGLTPYASGSPEATSARQSTAPDIFPELAHQPMNRDEVLMTIAETNHGK